MTSKTRVVAMLKADLKTSARDFEQLTLTFGFPVVLLYFLTQYDVVKFDGPAIDYLVPGVLILGIVSVAFSRLAVGLGFERSFGAIKRYSTTPLRSSEFLSAKLLGCVLVLTLQLGVIALVAYGLDWGPQLDPAIIGVAILTMVIFVSMGFLVGGLFDGLVSLAITNTVYLGLLLFSGLIFPLSRLPESIQGFVEYLPTTAGATLARASFAGEEFITQPWLVLITWAILTPIAAVVSFRWR